MLSGFPAGSEVQLSGEKMAQQDSEKENLRACIRLSDKLLIVFQLGSQEIQEAFAAASEEGHQEALRAWFLLGICGALRY